MRKKIVIFGFLLLFITLFVYCYQMLEAEYGTLLITIKWPGSNANNMQSSNNSPLQLHQEKSESPGGNQILAKSLPFSDLEKQAIVYERKVKPLQGFNEIVLLRFSLEPGGLVFEFDVNDSVYTIQAQLGIYNLVVEAFDSQGAIIFRADTTEILIEPNKSKSITLNITPNYPTEAPEFIGFSEVNSSNTGEYLLVWSSVSKAQFYTLEEDYTDTFLSSQIIYSGSDTTFQVTDREDSIYYYRVRAENDIDASPWSNVIAFQVQKVSELFINTDSLPDGTAGVLYAATVEASGGLLPYSWEIISGSLPPELETEFGDEDSASINIIGSPTEPGIFIFTLEVSDSSIPERTATKQLSITIDPRELQITTKSINPSCKVGEYYYDRIDAVGGSEGDWSWNIRSGSLPDGVKLKDENEFARIYGTANKTGQYTFTVMVIDNVYPELIDSKEFSIRVDEPSGFRITTTSLPNATAGVSYSHQLQASDGTPPYTWSETPASASYRSSTAFAEGIYINATGLLSGMCRDFPTTDQIEFQVVDSSLPQKTATKTFNFRILAGALFLYTSTTLPNGKEGTPYSENIVYMQGTPPLKTPWTFSGDWPIPGLSVSYSDQNYKLTISGTPTTADTYNFSVTIKDSSSPQKTRTDSFTLTIDP